MFIKSSQVATTLNCTKYNSTSNIWDLYKFFGCQYLKVSLYFQLVLVSFLPISSRKTTKKYWHPFTSSLLSLSLLILSFFLTHQTLIRKQNLLSALTTQNWSEYQTEVYFQGLQSEVQVLFVQGHQSEGFFEGWVYGT